MLALTADRPGIVSTVLAEAMGWERQDFKLRVRRLKELGLTLSLDVGYRLSPRGKSYLNYPGQRTVAEIHASLQGVGPCPLAAASCKSGLEIRIGDPARRRALVPPTLRGVSQAGQLGLGVVELGHDRGDAPADASQWTPYALRHVVVHRSSSVSGHLIAGHH